MTATNIEREFQLLRGGVAALVGPDRLTRAIEDYKFKQETPIYKCRLVPQATSALERYLGDPVKDLITLEDAAQRPRDEIAAIDGVGPQSIDKLDAAMAKAGLTWAVVV